MGENNLENKSYSRLARLYDLIHSDKDYKKEVEFIEFVIEKMSKRKVNSILDVACGTGSHAIYLKKNYFVIGIDSAKSMLEVAKKKVKDIDFFREDMRDFNLDRTFDALVCLNDSFSYNTTEEEIIDTLRCFSKHLENDGIILFDVLSILPKERVEINSFVENDTEVSRISKWVPNEKNTVRVEYIYFVRQGNNSEFHVDHHTYNLINLRRLRKLMKKAGFKDIHILNGFSKNRYKRGSPRAVFVGRYVRKN